MAASSRLLIMCKTYGGKIAKCVILVGAAILDPSSGAVNAIRAAIEAVSRVSTTRASLSKPGLYSMTSAAGDYEDDQDKAALTFVDAVGQYHVFKVPAPKAAIFAADHETVDLTNTAVINFAGYVTGNFVSKTGAALTGLVGGKRIRLRSGKRA